MANMLRLAVKGSFIQRYVSPTLAARIPMCFTRSLSLRNDSFMSGTNSIYVEQMYDAWLQDPKSVHKSWDAYFRNLQAGIPSDQSFTAPSNLSSATESIQLTKPTARDDSLALSHLIRAYQVRGHEVAQLDPLGLDMFRSPIIPEELDYRTHGFSENDLDRPLNIASKSSGGYKGFLSEMYENKTATLRETLKRLQETYCRTLGVEYMHIPSRTNCNFIRSEIEKEYEISAEKKLRIFERLCYAETFERFMSTKFNTVKRFGLDGGEALIPGLKAMIDLGTEMKITGFVFGMAHRGRLNVLANVLRKPMPLIFKEFQGSHFNLDDYVKSLKDGDWSMSSDVKYHLGTSIDRTYPDGRKVHISLAANPSHLEAVNPVVLGKCRARQFFSGNRPENLMATTAVLIHGDAAYAGQGVVYESMQMAKVPDFQTGGTIHVVINNQIGFTTDPVHGRSTQYASDIGKAFNVPVFHCNGDDPISVCRAFEIAIKWRQKFGEDCIIDFICYRKFGHNELDQPAFTQPIFYNKISTHPSTLEIYEAKLINEGVATKEHLSAIRSEALQEYEKAYNESKTSPPPNQDFWLSSRWAHFKSPRQLSRIRKTGVDLDELRKIGSKLATIPDYFKLHKQLEKIFEAKKKMIHEERGIDWGTAEALAFGTLLLEGNHVRLTGQDVERGTFSHRHAVLHDQQTNETYTPLNNLAKKVSPFVSKTGSDKISPELQAPFVVRNSILSEFGVLGFELGFSLENPNCLVLWEAQFGDFSNGAQVIIDQFISSGEHKWMRQSGLVMLLPHGYDGQGAEHSSCRLERYLQLCHEDSDTIPDMDENHTMQIQKSNWQVVNCTTPANYYHVLRRQVHREFRKPLIIASPKNLLRHRACVSNLEDMGPNTQFQRVIGETDKKILSNCENVRRLIFCSGKLYYELEAEREVKKINDIAITRIEQLSPFPFDKVAEQMQIFPNAEIVFSQEEPKNMGAWTFVQPRLITVMKQIMGKNTKPKFIGRPVSASPATGLGSKVHFMEQSKVINDSLN